MQELSLHVLDLAQNSVRAGASLVELALVIDHGADTLTITISDDGCGMSEEMLRQVTDPFFTTRTTRKVGLGIPLFQMAAEMAGGGLSITSAPGRGTRVTAVFGESHIDRMPVGDMNGTVLALIQLCGGVEFTYSYQVDGRSFTADTREFRAVLGDDIPLSSPEVLQFIGDFLSEHTEAVNNGLASADH